MNYKKIKKIACVMIIILFLLSANASAINITTEKNKQKNNFQTKNTLFKKENYEDYDPLCNINLTVKIKKIRALDEIDKFSEPDFFIKIIVNNEMKQSNVWPNTKYVENPNWSATFDVPDDKEIVNITIELWDKNSIINKKCDIGLNRRNIQLKYSLKTGQWIGDDYLNPSSKVYYDRSGYGCLNGCDDYSYNVNDLDCEVLFDITQTDPDGDGIPYWSEVELYGTDPEENNNGYDCDNDGVPIEWEHKWGCYMTRSWYTGEYQHRLFYDPFKWEDHSNMDPDEDGLNNIEEYLTSQWDSDPFRKDIFIEMDIMKKCDIIPDESLDRIKDNFKRHNIFLHIDDGCYGGGGVIIPFKDTNNQSDLQNYYYKYFLNNNSEHWRRGVFHYALIINSTAYQYHGSNFTYRIHGNAFSTTADGENYSVDSFQISVGLHEETSFSKPILFSITRKTISKKEQRIIVYGSVIMHELGHTLGLFSSNVPGVDRGPLNMDGNRADRTTILDYILWYVLYGNYKSCMNYGYVYNMIGYSDGSHGRKDNDDWQLIDLTFFQQ